MHTALKSCAARVRRSRGFTLLEIMVTFTIIALLLVIGVPAMGEFVADQRVIAVRHAGQVLDYLANPELLLDCLMLSRSSLNCRKLSASRSRWSTD